MAGGGSARATSAFAAPRPGLDDDFPVEGYDSLRSSQILELLPDLTLDELDMVREREEQGKNRATVIRRVDVRIAELEAQEDREAELEEDDLAAEGEPEPFDEEGEEAEADEEQFEPVAVAPEPASRGASDEFPIPDYDDLPADEIIAMLDDLDDEELDLVAEREERGRNRVEILDYIDDMFEEVPEGAPAPAPEPEPVVTTPPPPRPAAKKAAKKAAIAKVAPAGKAVAAKAAKKAGRPAKATVAKVSAVKAPAVKGPAVKLPSAKAAAGRAPKKAAAVASPGTKSVGRKAAATVKAAKVAPRKVAATKIVGKKAAPVKKR